jgi:DNA-binding NarL/FixJ family response regulator
MEVESSDTTTAIKLLELHAYHVLLCDFRLVHADTMAFMQAVRKTRASTAVVFTIEPNDLRRALLAMIEGASGYILRSDSADDFLHQLRAIWTRRMLLSSLEKPCRTASRK